MKKIALVALLGLAACTSSGADDKRAARQAWNQMTRTEQRELCENYNYLGPEIARIIAEREVPEYADVMMELMEEKC